MPAVNEEAKLRSAEEIARVFKEKFQREKEEAALRVYLEKCEANKRALAKDMEKFNESRQVTTSNGRQMSDWEYSHLKATEASSAETTAFNSEWKNALLGLLAVLSYINEALGNTSTQFAKQIKFQIEEKLFNRPESIKDVRLPELIHQITLNEEHKLDIKVATKIASFNERLEKKDNLNQESFNKKHPNQKNADYVNFNDLFRPFVTAWLEEQGYRVHPDPSKAGQFVHQATGVLLTATEFVTLRDDPINGLQSFFKENSALELQQESIGPRP